MSSAPPPDQPQLRLDLMVTAGWRMASRELATAEEPPMAWFIVAQGGIAGDVKPEIDLPEERLQLLALMLRATALAGRLGLAAAVPWEDGDGFIMVLVAALYGKGTELEARSVRRGESGLELGEAATVPRRFRELL